MMSTNIHAWDIEAPEATPEALYNAWQLISVAVSGVTGQEGLHLDLVPTLSSDQSVARGHARKWTDTYATSLVQPLTDMTFYTNLYNSFTPELMSSVAYTDKFVNGLGNLERMARVYQNSTTTAIDKLKAFQNLVDDDTSRFTNDNNELSRTYTGDGGELAQIASELGSFRKELEGLNAAISVGITKGIPGAIAFGVKIAFEATSIAGTGKAIIDTTLNFTKDITKKSLGTIASDARKFYDAAKGIPKVQKIVQDAANDGGMFTSVSKALEDADAAVSKSKETIEKYRNALEAQAAMQKQVGVFVTIKGHVDQISTRTGEAIQALETNEELWVRELDSLRALEGRVRASNPEEEVPDMLANNAAQWILRAQAARRLLGAMSDPQRMPIDIARIEPAAS
ncbi:HBL/NHE enterotoxin family protein [Streptomyces sp. NPDC007861]|uniref:HBL/NHE enterotoxin family protein n=1 Tax=Streptomyces sp. NPDC007861 TaxID=3154893 RepID=UPI00340C7B38